MRVDWADGLSDDDALALPATRHYRLLQRIHDPGSGQLSAILAWLSNTGRETIRHPHPEVLQVLDPRPLLDEAASIGGWKPVLSGSHSSSHASYVRLGCGVDG